MAGLENILGQIRADAQSTAEQAAAQAQKQADELLEQARAEAREKSAREAERTEAMVRDAGERAKSAADLERRRRLLSEKQSLISGILDEAQDALEQLPDAEYLEAIRKLASRYALPEQGEILFSEQDFARLPAGFASSLALPGGGSLTAKASAEVRGGGFLLRYGGIEENCTFPALFDAAREELQDKVSELLFSEK